MVSSRCAAFSSLVFLAEKDILSGTSHHTGRPANKLSTGQTTSHLRGPETFPRVLTNDWAKTGPIHAPHPRRKRPPPRSLAPHRSATTRQGTTTAGPIDERHRGGETNRCVAGTTSPNDEPRKNSTGALGQSTRSPQDPNQTTPATMLSNAAIRPFSPLEHTD